MNPQPGNDKGNVNFRAGDDSGVKYTDETGWRAMRYYREPQSPKLIQWVLKYSGGLIKDERQANYVLIGFAVLAIIVSLVLLFGFHTKTPKAVQYREDIPLEVRKKLPPGVWETIPSKFQ